ncbi:hypothetical protein C361_04309 [Cryptococcus neoformans Tu259-1]|uniref:Uncharacterized protein n=1 Tax=Cryptococcus neoformans Tu259-1 TaxID=1230072 RepID=A0A854Q9I2_CRYNE|nr:hypothetical protein C361_04309 [Cryptococcus neoformans var. grubii Tu259-1]
MWAKLAFPTGSAGLFASKPPLIFTGTSSDKKCMHELTAIDTQPVKKKASFTIQQRFNTAHHMLNRWGVEVNHRHVSDWVKEAVKIHKDYALSNHSSTAKFHCPPMNTKVHMVLHDWIEQALEDSMIM